MPSKTGQEFEWYGLSDYGAVWLGAGETYAGPFFKFIVIEAAEVSGINGQTTNLLDVPLIPGTVINTPDATIINCVSGSIILLAAGTIFAITPTPVTFELVSHWIGDNITGAPGTCPNEVVGKPVMTIENENDNIHWTGANSWEQATNGQDPNVCTGTITSIASDYSFMMALHSGSGYNGTIFQRLLTTVNGIATRFIDLFAYHRDEPTWSLWEAIGDDHMDISAIEPTGTNKIITIICEAPDMRVYKDGVLLGTLAGGYVQDSLDGTLCSLSREDGGARGYAASSIAEMKIWDGVLNDALRITNESAMAATYGITYP